MPQHATIRGPVTYREGEGMPIAIPEGPVELTFAADSVTLSWRDGDKVAGLTAMPLDQFNLYVAEGKIVLQN